MGVIDLPNDVLNVVLSYLFVDTLLEEEEYQNSVASARGEKELENFSRPSDGIYEYAESKRTLRTL